VHDSRGWRGWNLLARGRNNERYMDGVVHQRVVGFSLLVTGWVQGRISWREPHSPTLRNCKRVFDVLYAVGFLVLLYRHNALELHLLASLLALVAVYTGLSIYFASVKSKRELIARMKATRGISFDQPHKVDDILKEGFFRIR
jgi:hypothetical protein